jgi:hypothetical protein
MKSTAKQFPSFDSADFEPVKRIALTFPGTVESVSHENTPSVKVGKKLMCRLHETGQFVPIRLDFDTRDSYLNSHPEIFHLPDHFRAYPYVCMWVHNYDAHLLREVLEASWKSLATKKLLAGWSSR